MAIRVHSSGPAAVFVQQLAYTTSGTFAFATNTENLLGWCEVSPRITYSSMVAPLFNTLGGVELPYEYYPQSSVAMIECTLTRWREPLLAVLENIGTFQTKVASYTLPSPASVGLGVFIVYPLKGSLNPTNFRPCNIFPNCIVMRVVRDKLFTGGESVTVVFKSVPIHLAGFPFGTHPSFMLGSGAFTYTFGAINVATAKLGAHVLSSDAPAFGNAGPLFAALSAFSGL